MNEAAASPVTTDQPPAPVLDALQKTHPARAGMAFFLLSDVAFFGTLIVTYIYYLGQDTGGPLSPGNVLKLPITVVDTIFLLSSSATIHLALKALHAGAQAAFRLWWAATLVLGALFIAGTAVEWHDLIVNEGLWISSNLFGTCYYTLVGFHALHVTVGLVLLATVLGLALRGHVTAGRDESAEVISWYWHFVDGVWVVVFTLVYLVGR